MAELSAPTSRREEYAEATRRAIVAAARDLFNRQGFFATRVDDIAALARVSPATVYAVSGGKHGLLLAVIELAGCDVTSDVGIACIQAMDDPVAIVGVLAGAVRSTWEEFGDTVRVMLDTAPHDKTAAAIKDAATARYRGTVAAFSRRLAELDVLRPGFDADRAADVLWFYFGYWGLVTLHDEIGWDYASAEEWLCQEACRALLRPPDTRECRRSSTRVRRRATREGGGAVPTRRR